VREKKKERERERERESEKEITAVAWCKRVQARETESDRKNDINALAV
jgi:hypothetical protein